MIVDWVDIWDSFDNVDYFEDWIDQRVVIETLVEEWLELHGYKRGVAGDD